MRDRCRGIEWGFASERSWIWCGRPSVYEGGTQSIPNAVHSKCSRSHLNRLSALFSVRKLGMKQVGGPYVDPLCSIAPPLHADYGNRIELYRVSYIPVKRVKAAARPQSSTVIVWVAEGIEWLLLKCTVVFYRFHGTISYLTPWSLPQCLSCAGAEWQDHVLFCFWLLPNLIIHSSWEHFMKYSLTLSRAGKVCPTHSLNGSM